MFNWSVFHIPVLKKLWFFANKSKIGIFNLICYILAALFSSTETYETHYSKTAGVFVSILWIKLTFVSWSFVCKFLLLFLVFSYGSRSSSRWESRLHFYALRIYVRIYWLWKLVVFYSSVRRGYISKVSVHLVQKYFPHDCSIDSISCSKRWKRESDENSIKTRQQLDRDQTVLLLATWKQVKYALCCCCQFTRPVVYQLPHPPPSSIPWTRRLSSADASVVVVVVFVIVFLFRRLRRCRRFLGPIV